MSRPSLAADRQDMGLITVRLFAPSLLAGLMMFSAVGATPQATALLQTNDAVTLQTLTIRKHVTFSNHLQAVRTLSRELQEEPSRLPKESAERINAEAMRRYREQWRRFLKNPSAVPVPVLYPSKFQQVPDAPS